MKNCIKIFFALLCLLCIGNLALFSAPTLADEGFAEEEFRLGVLSFYRGSYNDAIFSFEKALSYLPNDSKILEWLGRAYYQSGIEGAAIQYWEEALANNYQGDRLLLQNQIDLVRERRVTGTDFELSARYVEAGSFPGAEKGKLYYSQPTSVLPQSNGSSWVVAYGSNELVHFDANGAMIERVRGPVNGFDRPLDIIKNADGNLLVSEYAGDRISVLSPTGKYLSSFGKKGRNNGELFGPQYMDIDSSGNVYVSDFGNCRVTVFNSEGEGLFFFGKKTSSFEGFSAPSGIAILDDVVYVADAVAGTIYMFDTAGNYLDILVPNKTFTRPESLKHWQNYLLVADSNKVFAVDTSNGAVFEMANTGKAPSRITSAVPDVNGNVLVTDFTSNEVFVMSKMSELVGGLLVHIEKVNAENFPKVTVDIRVENRERKAVVGLSDGNFLITENRRPVSNQKVTGIAQNNDVCDIALVIDRSISLKDYGELVVSAVKDISASMAGSGTVHLISAGDVPVLEMSGNPELLNNFTKNQLQAPQSSNVALDLGVRLAVNKLIPGQKKRAIIFITAGDVSTDAFNSYGLADLSAYMNNNAVSFAVINLNRNNLKSEIQFLVEETGGKEYYIFRPNGISMVVKELLEKAVGSYQLSFTSSLSTDFGRKFLPIEIESYLLNRSGRAESGYYAPLQ